MKTDRYQELFNRSADANLIIVGDRFVDCNLATVIMLGYKDKQELLNTHPSQLSPETQPDGQLSYVKANEMMDIAFSKGSHRFEWNHMRANGEVFPVEVLLTCIPDDNEKTLHVVWRDITERKRADQELRESRNQLHAIFNSTKDGILVADIQTKTFLTGNDAICELLGYTLEEILTLSVDKIHPEEALPQVIDAFEKQAKEEIDLAMDIPVLRKNETVFYADIATSLVTFQGVQCMIGMFRDVTERRKHEEKDRRKQKLEAIGTLAGGVAHDFNNILTAILGYSELSISELSPGSRLHDNLSEVIRAGKRAAEIVKQILAFSKHTTGNFTPKKLQPVVNEVLHMLRATIPTTIEIKKEIDDNCGFVLADESQIHQILVNLCTNAFHVLEKTGGTITVKLEEVNFTTQDETGFGGLAPGRYLNLQVSDNGPGIDNETAQHIFDPYFTTKASDKGSGLGLAVAYGIVKDHDGAIKVESNHGRGATFKVFLPVIDSGNPGAVIENDGQTPYSAGNERILFVDDEEPIAKLGKRMLETLGYSVNYQTNSVLALAEFRETPYAFDLVITDQTMPDLPGSELSRELMKIRPDIPVILCTGYSSMVSEAEAKDLGIRAFVMKPADRQTLANTVKSVLDGQ